MASASRSSLGARLRALRLEKNWRISDVSQMTGLAASTISKVENNRMSLTYDKLQQLAHGLSMDMAELLGERREAERLDLAAARRSLERAGEGALITTEHYEYRYLNTDLAPKSMVPSIGV